MTGFGRLGSMFGSDHYGIEPDIITIAKGLTSAYAPLSAALSRYSVIVLPEQIALPPEADELLAEWVETGGCLIASGRVSPRIVEDIPTFALGDTLGITWTGRQRSDGWIQHRGLPLRFGHVCWRKKFKHGLVFQQSFRLDELARYTFELQPFAPEPVAENAGKMRYA